FAMGTLPHKGIELADGKNLRVDLGRGCPS
ncbi:MAG: hypothetical protein ACI8XZ_005062, partial [Gammaproteobacteria bacterium]